MAARGSVLIEHGYQLMPDGKIVPKPCRPKTQGEARKYIVQIFDKNRWDERDRRKYMEMHDVEPKNVEDLSADEIRLLLKSMEDAQMILFRED